MKINILRSILFTLGLILFADGLVLIIQKKVHLGTILPFIIGFILCLYAVYLPKFHVFLKNHALIKKLWLIASVGFVVWLITLFGFFYYLHTQIQDSKVDLNTQAILILGSGVIQGKPSPTLALRLDRGAEIAAQIPKALVIVTGGQDFGEQKTEAAVMSEYLVQHYPFNSSRILLEDQSTSTELNLKNSLKILEAHHLSLNSPIAIVTSDFHTVRAQAIAHKQGYQNITLFSAQTPFMTRYNAWLREYFAYMSGWVLDEY